MTMRLDQALLRPASRRLAAQGHRAVPPRAAAVGVPRPVGLRRSSLARAGQRDGAAGPSEIGEFYYVMNGEGTVNVGARTRRFESGDAVPIQLNETKSFENTGASPLELLVVGVVRDVDKKFDVVHAAGARRARELTESHGVARSAGRCSSRRGWHLAPAVCVGAGAAPVLRRRRRRAGHARRQPVRAVDARRHRLAGRQRSRCGSHRGRGRRRPASGPSTISSSRTTTTITSAAWSSWFRA